MLVYSCKDVAVATCDLNDTKIVDDTSNSRDGPVQNFCFTRKAAFTRGYSGVGEGYSERSLQY